MSSDIDPTKNPPEERPYGSRAPINACKEYKFIKKFSKRSRIRQAVYEKLVAQCKSLVNFPPPTIREFERDGLATATPKPNGGDENEKPEDEGVSIRI